jgi:hypothetical protein
MIVDAYRDLICPLAGPEPGSPRALTVAGHQALRLAASLLAESGAGGPRPAVR